MARRGQGLGAGTRISMRGFSQLLSDLPREVQQKLQDAFVEAEDLVDFHSLSVPQRVTRRRLSGSLESPVVTGTSSILGGSIKWPRLKDPRIIMYEIQIDDVDKNISALLIVRFADTPNGVPRKCFIDGHYP